MITFALIALAVFACIAYGEAVREFRHFDPRRSNSPHIIGDAPLRLRFALFGVRVHEVTGKSPNKRDLTGIRVISWHISEDQLRKTEIDELVWRTLWLAKNPVGQPLSSRVLRAVVMPILMLSGYTLQAVAVFAAVAIVIAAILTVQPTVSFGTGW